MRLSLVALVIATMAGACDSSSQATGPQASASSVAAHPDDVLNNLLECMYSGSIDDFLGAEKTANPAGYTNDKRMWDQAQTEGATAGQVAYYASTPADCAGLMQSPSASPSFDYVENYVFQFTNEANAAQGFVSGAIVDPASFQSGGVSGSATGLGPNSIEQSVFSDGTTRYVAVWQNKAFMVLVVIGNLDLKSSLKITASVNSHIS